MKTIHWISLIAAVLCSIVASAPAGSVVAWGYDSDDQVTDTPAGNSFVSVDPGSYHSLALLDADSDGYGTIAAWGISGGGTHDYGQVTATPGDANFFAISAGGGHSLALQDIDGDGLGTIVGWGRADAYTAILPTDPDMPTDDAFVAVAASTFHSVALRGDGTIVCWGSDNAYGQRTNVPTGNDFVAISSFGRHSLALEDADGDGYGSVVAWGYNAYDQRDGDAEDPKPTSSDIIAVSAGVHHSMALRDEDGDGLGTIVTWGRDVAMIPTELANVDDFIAIAAGHDFGVALRSDGTLEAWGDDSYQVPSDKPGGSDFYAITASNHVLALEVPEPATLGLLALGGLALLKRRKNS